MTTETLAPFEPVAGAIAPDGRPEAATTSDAPTPGAARFTFADWTTPGGVVDSTDEIPFERAWWGRFSVTVMLGLLRC